MVIGDAPPGDAPPGAGSIDSSGAMFGLCCCAIQPIQATGLQSVAYAAGWASLTVLKANFTIVDGQRWTTIITTATVNVAPTGGGAAVELIVNGTLVIDNLNGSIGSHTVDTPVGYDFLSNFIDDIDHATSVTDSAASWTDLSGTYQSIALSNPIGLSDLKLQAESTLLGAVDIHTLTPYGDSFTVQYQHAETDVSRFAMPIATWVADPLDLTGLTPAPAWVDLFTGVVVLDRDIPAHATVTLETIDNGLLDLSFSGGRPQVQSIYSNDEALVWTTAQCLIRLLTPGSNHCKSDSFNAAALALGDTNACSVAGPADISGEFLLDFLSVSFDVTLEGPESTRTFYVGFMPTMGGNGCPCIIDI